jgi:hypothetical protein
LAPLRVRAYTPLRRECMLYPRGMWHDDVNVKGLEGAGCRYPWIAYEHLVRAEAVYPLRDVARLQLGDQPRQNRRLMEFIESATVSIIASATAVETQILVVACGVYGRLRAAYDEKGDADMPGNRFAHCFVAPKEPLPLAPAKPFRARDAQALYDLAQALVHELGSNPPWPAGAYENVAEPRNALVHRTVQIVELDRALDQPDEPQTTVTLLEDQNPDELMREMRLAFETSCACTDCLAKHFHANERWEKDAMMRVRAAWIAKEPKKRKPKPPRL